MTEAAEAPAARAMQVPRPPGCRAPWAPARTRRRTRSPWGWITTTARYPLALFVLVLILATTPCRTGEYLCPLACPGPGRESARRYHDTDMMTEKLLARRLRRPERRSSHNRHSPNPYSIAQSHGSGPTPAGRILEFFDRFLQHCQLHACTEAGPAAEDSCSREHGGTNRRAAELSQNRDVRTCRGYRGLMGPLIIAWQASDCLRREGPQ